MNDDEVKHILLDFAQMLMNTYPEKTASQISISDAMNVIEMWFEKHIKKTL